jgi:hypothetical protein
MNQSLWREGVEGLSALALVNIFAVFDVLRIGGGGGGSGRIMASVRIRRSTFMMMIIRRQRRSLNRPSRLLLQLMMMMMMMNNRQLCEGRGIWDELNMNGGQSVLRLSD